MMMHLDIGVTNLEAAVYDAIALGAELHVHQPQDDVRVMLDPAGHPFCLYVDPGDSILVKPQTAHEHGAASSIRLTTTGHPHVVRVPHRATG